MVARLAAVFRERGYDGASLAELSRAAGLGRSSLYHYFPGGKEDMARAVFDQVNRWIRDEALAPLRAEGTPAERLDRMIGSLDSFYAGGRDRCLLGNLVLGGARNLFQEQLSAAFRAWIDALTAVAAEAGVDSGTARERAESAVVQIQGALVLAGGLDDPAPFRRVLSRLPAQLLAR